MIGIYSITDKSNGNMYIGQSIDIKRRFAEHKTPKARGNDKLHRDIQEKGIDNFDFSLIEECSIDDLNHKELQYIKKYKPYYNTIGKEVPKEIRKRISNGTKKWWDSLPQEKKEFVIKNNLKGPAKGHTVPKITREKISIKVSEIQKQKVRCVETNEIFDSVSDFEKSVGACTGTCAAYWKGKIKSVKGYHVEKCRD